MYVGSLQSICRVIAALQLKFVNIVQKFVMIAAMNVKNIIWITVESVQKYAMNVRKFVEK